MGKPVTFIQASVPARKGPAEHIETTGLAMTQWTAKGEVTEIHTPQETLQRIQETMHAKRSSGKGPAVDYPKVKREIAEIVEDCRLHTFHWPWPHGTTPSPIANDVHTALAQEVKIADSEEAKTAHPF